MDVDCVFALIKTTKKTHRLLVHPLVVGGEAHLVAVVGLQDARVVAYRLYENVLVLAFYFEWGLT